MAKNTDSSHLAAQRIQELPVAADGDVEVSASARVRPDDRSGDRVNVPPLPIVNPAMVDDPAFEAERLTEEIATP